MVTVTSGAATMVGLEQRHVLGPQPLAVHHLAARLEPGGFELADQIVDRLGLGRGGDAAPFERVRAKRLVMRREPGGVEGEGGRGGSPRKQQGGNGQGGERDAQGENSVRDCKAANVWNRLPFPSRKPHPSKRGPRLRTPSTGGRDASRGGYFETPAPKL